MVGLDLKTTPTPRTSRPSPKATVFDFYVVWETDDQVLVFVDQDLVYRGPMPVELASYIDAMRETFESLSRTTAGQVALAQACGSCPKAVRPA